MGQPIGLRPACETLERRVLLSITLDWAASFGADRSNRGLCVAPDGAGGAYVAGISEPNPYSVSRVFLSRYSPAGKVVWSHTFATSGSPDRVNALAVDAKGLLILSLRLGGTVDLDPGVAVFRAGASGRSSDYILKLTPDRNLVWAGEFPGTTRVTDLALDAASNIHLIGSFVGSADLNPTRGKVMFTSRGGRDVFVEQLSVNGKLIWAGTMGSAGIPSHSYDPDDSAGGIAVDPNSGDVIVGGTFIGKADFDPNPAKVLSLQSAGLEDIFIARLSRSGNRIWATRLGGSGDDQLHDLAIDRAHRTIISGRFEGSLDADPGAAVKTLRESSGANLLLRLNADASLGWVRQFDLGDWRTERLALAVGADNSVYATGSFSGDVDFDPGPGKFILSGWAGDMDIDLGDIFALHLSPGGAFLDAARIGRDSIDEGNAIATDTAGRFFITGQFSDKVDFDPGADEWWLSTTHDWDAFVMRLTAV